MIKDIQGKQSQIFSLEQNIFKETWKQMIEIECKFVIIWLGYFSEEI